MNYSSLKSIVLGIAATVFTLLMNSTKGELVKLFTDPYNLTDIETRKLLLFLIALLVTTAVAVNKFFDVQKLKKKKQKDLFPYFDKDFVKESSKNYVSTQMQNIPPSKEGEIIDTHAIAAKENAISFFLKKGLKESSIRHYLVLAGAGMGKTTFMINLYLKYIDQYSPDFNIKLIPLNNLDGLKDLDEIPSEEVGKTILLLDSLDEDPLAIDDYTKRLEDIMKKVWRFRKVIITCRTQFFPNQESEPHEIPVPDPRGGIFQFKKIYLSPFTIQECKKYLRKKYGILPNKKKTKAIEILDSAVQIMVRPMLLSKIDDLLDSDKNYKELNKIYEQIVEGWVEREGEKQALPDKGKEEFKSNLIVFSKKIALELYRKWRALKIASLTEKEVQNVAEIFNISLEKWEVTGKSLLNRDAVGNWKFAHKSIWEYFIAKQALENKTFAEKVNFGGLNFAELLYKEMTLLPFFENIYSTTPFKELERLLSTEVVKQISTGLISEIEKIENLNLYGLRIQDIEPLRNLTQLKSLYLRETKIQDIEPLRNLTQLKSLNLRGTKIQDIEPLRNLTQLKSLYLEGTRIQDIEPLRNLTQLKSLYLRETKIQDIELLKNLTQLKSLNLDGTRIQDIEPLRNLTQLKFLYLRETKIQDIEPLRNLTKLKSLYLRGTKIQDIELLMNLTKLKSLDLDGTRIQDIEPLRNLTQLKFLNLRGTKIQDIEPLRNLTQLEFLNLRGTKIQDIELLMNLTQLKFLYLRETKVNGKSISKLKKALPKCIIDH